MKTEKTTTEKLIDVLSKEKEKFSKAEGSLAEVYSKFSKMGINIKTTYSLPLKDTIGRTFREQMQFKNQ